MRVLFALAAVAALSMAATTPTTSFAPLTTWKNAVLAGSQSQLMALYSTDPRRTLLIGKQPTTLDEEAKFWAGLPSQGLLAVNPQVLSLEEQGREAKLLLRLQLQMKNGQKFVASIVQIWLQEPNGWHIAASQRSQLAPDAGRRLPEPTTPNPNLYPPPAAAESELHQAEQQAAREHKRVLVVFGANWCYDCHVLDKTLHSPSFAPLVDTNYVVTHINTGDEGKDNAALAARLGVVLDRGIPSLAVLQPDGKVLVAQQNGEFESTVKIGPEDVRAFLQKWKPAR